MKKHNQPPVEDLKFKKNPGVSRGCEGCEALLRELLGDEGDSSLKFSELSLQSF
jgi:hypothetical protein